MLAEASVGPTSRTPVLGAGLDISSSKANGEVEGVTVAHLTHSRDMGTEPPMEGTTMTY